MPQDKFRELMSKNALASVAREKAQNSEETYLTLYNTYSLPILNDCRKSSTTLHTLRQASSD